MPTDCSQDSFDFGTVEGRRVVSAFDGGQARTWRPPAGSGSASPSSPSSRTRPRTTCSHTWPFPRSTGKSCTHPLDARTARSSGAPTWLPTCPTRPLSSASATRAKRRVGVQRRYMTLETLEGLSDDLQAKPRHIAVAQAKARAASLLVAMTGPLTPPSGTRPEEVLS